MQAASPMIDALSIMHRAILSYTGTCHRLERAQISKRERLAAYRCTVTASSPLHP